MEWLKNNYEKVILWLVLLSWVVIGGKFYFTWMEKMNPSSIDKILKPSKNWKPEIVNKDIKKGEFGNLALSYPFSYYREIYTRNLFFPLSPFNPPKENISVRKKEKGKKKEESMNLVCTGVMSMGVRIVAVLKNTTTGKTYFAEEGNIIEGWRVEKITSSSVILTRKGRPIFELKIGG